MTPTRYHTDSESGTAGVSRVAARRPSAVALLPAVCLAAMLVVLAGCIADRGDEPEPTPPEPTTWAEWTDGIEAETMRYRTIEDAFCEQVNWDEAIAGSGWEVDELREWHTYDRGEPPPDAAALLETTCRVRLTTDNFPDNMSVGGHTGVYLQIRSTAGDTSEPEAMANATTTEPITGWWEEGLFTQRVTTQPAALASYRVRHENLYFETFVDMGFYDPRGEEVTSDDVAAMTRDLGRALLDEVTPHLPCDPLTDDAIVTHCDSG